MKDFVRSKRVQILFMIAGAFGGFLYWKFIGCESGTCVIKSVWYWSTLWGATVGYLVGDFIFDILKKRKERKESSEREISERN